MRNRTRRTAKPLVYSIVLTWNNFEDTAECLDSVRRLDYANNRILLVDNGSNDTSIQKLQRLYSEVEIVSNGKNLGYAAGNNVGIKCALGNNAEYILLLNNDVVVRSNLITEFIKVFSEYPDAGILGAVNYYYHEPDVIQFSGGLIDWKRGNISDFTRHKENSAGVDRVRRVDTVAGSCLFIPSDVVRKIGLLDSKYFFNFEETDWCCRARECGYEIYSCMKAEVLHKVSISGKKQGSGSNVLKYYSARNKFRFLIRNSPRMPLMVSLPYHAAASLRNAVRKYLFGNREEAFLILKGLRDGMLWRHGPGILGEQKHAKDQKRQFFKLIKNTLKGVLPEMLVRWIRVRRENSRYRLWRFVWRIREGFFPERYFRDPYMSKEVYWLDPESIRYRTLKEFNYYRDHNSVVGGDWDVPLLRFDDEDFYRAYELRVKEGATWSETKYYEKNLRDIESGIEKWGCRTKEQWDERCKLLDDIYEDIKKNGYNPTKLEDYISINVGRDGDLLFNDGRHRLTFCKLNGVRRIPIRITARHAKWVAFKKQIFEYSNRAANRNGKVYAQLTHVDLQSVNSGYGDKRFELIKGNLSARSGGSVLDIGAHWGYFCHQFEDLGLNCTAVENNAENLYFLRKLRRAESRSFEVFDKSIFSLDVKQKYYDVVLAIAVFHHFTKEEGTFNLLREFLGRLHLGEMYFQPPDPKEVQMARAYRNFQPSEFVEFIIENSRLRNAREIGLAEDGRKLFKLW